MNQIGSTPAWPYSDFRMLKAFQKHLSHKRVLTLNRIPAEDKQALLFEKGLNSPKPSLIKN